MRTLLISTVAVAALFAGAAQAKDGFYVAPNASWLIITDVEEDGVELSFDNGFTLGGAAGYRFGQFRIEGEIAYGEADMDTVALLGQEFEVDGTFEYLGLTIGGFYDFNTGGGFTPYVGAGAGLADLSIDDITIAGETAEGDNSTEFSLFGEVGLSVPLSDRLELVPAYRFTWVDTGTDIEAHTIRVGLRYGF